MRTCYILASSAYNNTHEDSYLRLESMPDLFLPGYTRICTNQPRITDDKKGEELSNMKCRIEKFGPEKCK